MWGFFEWRVCVEIDMPIQVLLYRSAPLDIILKRNVRMVQIFVFLEGIIKRHFWPALTAQFHALFQVLLSKVTQIIQWTFPLEMAPDRLLSVFVFFLFFLSFHLVSYQGNCKAKRSVGSFCFVLVDTKKENLTGVWLFLLLQNGVWILSPKLHMNDKVMVNSSVIIQTGDWMSVCLTVKRESCRGKRVLSTVQGTSLGPHSVLQRE